MAVFNGKEIEIPALTINDCLRVAKVTEAAMKHISLDPEQVTEELTFQHAFRMIAKILDGAFADFQVDLLDPDDKGKPGMFAQIVFTELSRITGVSVADILAAGQGPFLQLCAEIWRQEADGPFGTTLRTLIRPYSSLLSLTFALLREQILAFAVSVGGRLNGGGPSSSSQSLKQLMDGVSGQFENSPLLKPSNTSEPQPSGQS